MIVGVRASLRAASIFLLSLAAPLAIFASAPPSIAPALPQSQSSPGTSLPATSSASRLHFSTQAHPCPRTTASLKAVSSQLAGRIYVEDTPPPSTAALETVPLQTPLNPSAPPLALTPPLRNTSTSVSNRQRAP